MLKQYLKAMSGKEVFKRALMAQDKKVRMCLEDTFKLKKIASLIKSAKNVVLTGCGDKFMISMISKCLADYCLSKPFEVYHSRILANNMPKTITKDSIIFFLTVRGKTIDVIEAIKEAKKRNAKIVIITQLEKKHKDSIYSVLKGYDNYEVIIPIKGDATTQPSTTTSATFLSIINAIILYSADEEMDINPFLQTLMNGLPKYLKEISNNKSFHDFCVKSALKIKKAKNPFLLFTGDGPRYPVCKKASQIQFLEQCKLPGIAFQSEEFANLILEEYINKDFGQIWILLKPIESFSGMNSMNRFNEMNLMINEKFKEDRIIIIDPLAFALVPGKERINDFLLCPIYLLIIEWISYYCSV